MHQTPSIKTRPRVSRVVQIGRMSGISAPPEVAVGDAVLRDRDRLRIGDAEVDHQPVLHAHRKTAHGARLGIHCGDPGDPLLALVAIHDRHVDGELRHALIMGAGVGLGRYQATGWIVPAATSSSYRLATLLRSLGLPASTLSQTSIPPGADSTTIGSGSLSR